MKTISINPETLAELKTGKVEGISVEMANYIESIQAVSVEISPKGFMSEGYVSIEDAHGITSICNLNQTIFDCSIL